jgi:hypothetical protein
MLNLPIKKKFFLLAILTSFIFIVLSKDTKQSKAVNYQVIEYKIPLYLKLFNFYGRHLNYSFIVNEITQNSKNDIEKVLDISKWMQTNIKKIPKEVDVVDSHPLTIIERGLGTEDQFSDLLSVLLVYAGLDAFMWFHEDNYKDAITIYKVNGKWSVIDPYYGIVFLNNDNRHASITELKNLDLNNGLLMHNLNYERIESDNIRLIFGNKFNHKDGVVRYYTRMFDNLPTKNKINNTSVFQLGGRSYTQSPLSRLKFTIYNYLEF